MVKSHCSHRVVIRDQSDKIVFDQQFDNFANAKPEYERHTNRIKDGQELTLQHGARIIFKTTN